MASSSSSLMRGAGQRSCGFPWVASKNVARMPATCTIATSLWTARERFGRCTAKSICESPLTLKTSSPPLGGRVIREAAPPCRFDVDVPGGPVLKESKSTAPGGAVVVTDSPAGRLGVTVCYDLRFPELYQRLRFSEKAQVLLVPSAFTQKTGEAHWEVLLRARAIECQCFVMAAAQAGRHNDKRESYGDALIIDPWGTVIGRCSGNGCCPRRRLVRLHTCPRERRRSKRDGHRCGSAGPEAGGGREGEDAHRGGEVDATEMVFTVAELFAWVVWCSTGATMCTEVKGRKRFRHCEESASGSTLLRTCS